MNAIEFKQKLKEHVDLQYKRLKETRKLEKSFEGLNIWEENFQKIQFAESILSLYIETLKYTKKRWFRKSETLYKDVKYWEFEKFYLENNSIYYHEGLSKEQNAKRYWDYMAPLIEAHNILNQIIKSE